MASKRINGQVHRSFLLDNGAFLRNRHGSLLLHSHLFYRLPVASRVCNVNANVIASAS